MEYGDRLAITTPEGIEVELALAGVGSRFLATCADLLIMAAIGALYAVGVALAFAGGIETLFFSVGAFLLLFGYDVAWEVLAGGRTPGKRRTGLRVVRDTGAPVTFVTSAIRNVLRLVDFLPVAYGVGMTAVFVTRNNQRLGDLAAGTIVTREPRRPGTVAPPGPDLETSRPSWDTSAITREDLATAHAFLERRATLTAAARQELAQTLADRLRAKTAGAPPLDHEAFLERLVAQRD